jgi:hypothetical protein
VCVYVYVYVYVSGSCTFIGHDTPYLRLEEVAKAQRRAADENLCLLAPGGIIHSPLMVPAYLPSHLSTYPSYLPTYPSYLPATYIMDHIVH